MSDLAYTFSNLASSTADHTARLAVLWPLVLRGDDNSAEAQIQAALKLMQRWRQRLVELRDAGWQLLVEDGKKIQYLRNCYPSMLIIDQLHEGGRTCKVKDICPWCYGRRVAEVYKRIWNAMTVDEKLVATVGHDDEEYILPPDGKPGRSVRELLLDHQSRLAKLVNSNLPDCKGVYFALTVEPSVEIVRPNRWRVTYHIIALQDLGRRFDWIPAKWKTLVYERPSADHLKDAVYKVLRYPEGMMRGDAKQVVEVLHARSQTQAQ